MEKTTIQINLQTLERLKSMKSFDRQSYDELLNNILDNFDDEELTHDEIEEIKLGLDNVRKGKTKPIEQVARELGIRLR